MLSRNHASSRILRLALLVALAGALAIPSGCSWFRRHKTPTVTAVAPGEGLGTLPEGAGGELTPPPSPEATTEQRPSGQLMDFPEGTVRTVYFDFDRSDIRPDQVAVMDSNMRYLQAHPEARVYVEGHCDERGTIEYNFSLGQRRASSVRDYLVSHGVANERIAVSSKGEEQPADPGHNEAAWARNRRVEFKQMM